jgi:hypothetical protein
MPADCSYLGRVRDRIGAIIVPPNAGSPRPPVGIGSSPIARR